MADPDTGSAVLDVLRSLLPEEPEVSTSVLHAAVFSAAIKSDESPRDVLERLWKNLPSSEAWPTLRDALVAANET